MVALRAAEGEFGNRFGQQKLADLPRYRSAGTVTEPSCSVRVTRRLPCSQGVTGTQTIVVLDTFFERPLNVTGPDPTRS